jgi:hypothetical protein
MMPMELLVALFVFVAIIFVVQLTGVFTVQHFTLTVRAFREFWDRNSRLR